MEVVNKTDTFFEELTAALEDNGFISVTISQPRDKHSRVKNIYFRPVTLKEVEMVHMVIKYPDREETKNLSHADFLAFLRLSLDSHFGYAHLLLKEKEGHLLISKRGFATLKWKKTIIDTFQLPVHNKEKTYLVPTDAPYLRPLGITNAGGNVIKEHYKKYKQICRYVELFAPLTEGLEKDKNTVIADMGCGKGYLTFAMHEYMRDQGFNDLHTTGIDIKTDVIDNNNRIAEDIGYDGLEFINGTIEATEKLNPDILIALHACDTATDDALFYGIQQKSKVIVVAPCCHKQVRKAIGQNELTDSLFRYGIMKERFATDITDLIRANILRYLGYTVKVIEFVGQEHTPKNIMITAVYTGRKNEAAMAEIRQWMDLYAISSQALLDKIEAAGL